VGFSGWSFPRRRESTSTSSSPTSLIGDPSSLRYVGVSPPNDEADLLAASRRARPYISAKGPKTILAVAWPFGCPARFTDPGGGQTRCAQTLPAFSPVSVALLGHATRPGEPSVEGGTTHVAQTRPANSLERPSKKPFFVRIGAVR